MTAPTKQAGKILNFRIPEDEADAFAEACRRAGRTQTEVLREAVRIMVESAENGSVKANV